MSRTLPRITFWLIGLLLLGMGLTVAAAQDVCAPVVEQALQLLGNNCTSLGRNVACYGYNRVTGTFAQTTSATFFTQPSDIANLIDVITLQTAPLDTTTTEWGIAVLNAQADVPDHLPGQAVTFMLMGDAQIENRSADTNPMQAFYFRTGVRGVQCDSAPSVLAIRSPEGLKVHLNANGADVTLGSFVMLETLPGDEEMRITTLEGEAIIDEGQPDEVRIPAGTNSLHCVQPVGQWLEVAGDCQWTPPQPNSPSPGADTVTQARDALGLPAEGQQCPTGRSNRSHTVQAGESLSAIASYYEVDLAALAAANGLTNPRLILVGQTLTVPCANDKPAPPASSPLGGGGQGGTSGSVDCTGFAGTSPMGGILSGPTTFYWNTIDGATGYRVNVYRQDGGGGLVGSYSAGGAGTNSLVANLSPNSIGAGTLFSWEVVALNGDEVVCSSGPFSAVRDVRESNLPTPVPAPPVSPPVTEPFSAYWICHAAGILQIDWSNLPAGDKQVYIKFMHGADPVSRTEPSTSSGSILVAPITAIVTDGWIQAQPSGTWVALGSSIDCTG